MTASSTPSKVSSRDGGRRGLHASAARATEALSRGSPSPAFVARVGRLRSYNRMDLLLDELRAAVALPPRALPFLDGGTGGGAQQVGVAGHPPC